MNIKVKVNKPIKIKGCYDTFIPFNTLENNDEF